MDYLGSLPETSRRNKHILVVVDHFTKWCEAFATPDKKSQHSCATSCKPHFFLGSPFQQSCIQTKVEILKTPYCTKYVILWALRKVQNAHYKLPSLDQCDGQTERQNRNIQAMFSAFASKRRDDWFCGCGWIQ
jgi:hypothetical protein